MFTPNLLDFLIRKGVYVSPTAAVERAPPIV